MHLKTYSQVPAVVLAAGAGVRLSRPDSEPKCLTPVLGRPLLAWLLDALAGGGVSTVHLILGSKADRIERAVASLASPLEVGTTRCPDWILGNGRSAAHAATVVGGSERFLLVMSDHLICARHVSVVLGAGASIPGCVLATAPPGAQNLDLEDATKVVTDSSGRIREIGKGLTRYDAIDTGVFSMTPRLFPALAQAYTAGDHSLTGGNRVLAAEGVLFARSIGDVPWQDVDTPEDLVAAERVARCLVSPEGRS